MLSWDEGRPIAIIKGGKKDGCILSILEEKDDNRMIKNKKADVIDEDYIKGMKKNMTSKQKKKLKRFMEDEDYDYENDEELKEMFEQIAGEATKRSMTEYQIFDEGRIQPLPRFDKTERPYIAGPTDSGKSYYIKNYLEQMVKVHPDKNVYLISDVDEDPQIDAIKNVMRVDLDEYKGEDEIKPADYEDSIVVFDDIDSLEKKTYRLVSHFRDKLLRRGRHDNISTVTTNHALTNYGDTRVIMNEASSITFFPKSSGIDQIKYTLKKYCGFDKDQIKKVLGLPSRWITVYKNVPRYVLFEKGAYVL